MKKSTTYSQIGARADALGNWLEEFAPYTEFDQRHLDAGTPEQAYWHLGYRTALWDLMALLNDSAAGSVGNASRYPEADQDE